MPVAKKKKAELPRSARGDVYRTKHGRMVLGSIEDSLESSLGKALRGKVNLIFTSPPFPLVRKKRYGNETGETYLNWLRDLAPKLCDLLAPDGSIVVEIGNSWEPLAPGYWGLNDRDIGIKRAKQPQLLDGLFVVLKERGSGIHISELPSELSEIAQITPTALFSLASIDPRFQLNTAEYLFLREWNSPRRETLLDAVTHILTEADVPLSFDAIVQQAEFRTKRVCDRRAISGCLKAIEATFDGNFWRIEKSTDADDDEPPFDFEENAAGAAH